MPPTRQAAPVGEKFGNWTVISNGTRSGYWICQCVCGVEKEVRHDTLKSHKSTNCGCIKRENWIKRNTKYYHNETDDEPFYRRWQEMRNRVLGSNYPIYRRKGIIICDRWLDEQFGFINFKDDMYTSYLIHLKEHGQNETTLDRINNDGNYEPSNCRWATRKQQAHNSDRWRN